ncbi:glutamate--tRNA ligase [Flavobacteriaceae bacterium]|nr:glutamate--tRNA ligase [Flavobacteriaceae bacterium]
MKTRVRFAPSPTGPLHIGGLRTALFNYLYARKHKGTFILRVEDTDQNRYVSGSETYIQEALEWCGMVPDEGPVNGGAYGPYRQSERRSIYKKHIDQLIASGTAYYAFDLTDTLDTSRKEAEQKGETFRYGSHNRMQFRNSLTLSDNEIKAALEGDYVVRLKVTPGQRVSVTDEVRGNVTVESDLLDDKILMKSDGMPTYHFANVVDDRLMEITTVIRGEEWLPSLPMHKLIYDAFGWETPKFMHLPLILKPNGKGKLSKRDGDKDGFPVFPLEWGEDTPGFREMGFLPEGLVNYLALLGWNDGSEKELFSLTELEAAFRVEGVQKAGARFDYEKAKSVNHQYLSKADAGTLLVMQKAQEVLNDFEEEKQLQIIKLFKERLYTINDLEEEIAFLRNPHPYDEKSVAKIQNKNPLMVLRQIALLLENQKEGETIKNDLFQWAKDNDVPLGLVMQSFRLSLVGKLTGPDLFEICTLLGKNVSLKRVQNFIQYLS